MKTETVAQGLRRQIGVLEEQNERRRDALADIVSTVQNKIDTTDLEIANLRTWLAREEGK